MERLTVEAIEDPRGLRAFIRFPEFLYRDDPNLPYYPALLERAGLRPVLVADLPLVAEWAGRPMGLFLCLPDLNPARCAF